MRFTLSDNTNNKLVFYVRSEIAIIILLGFLQLFRTLEAHAECCYSTLTWGLVLI